MMAPKNLAVWSRSDGDHILVLEFLGAARIGQWDSTGKLEREWMTPQSKANDGWALDNPNHAFVMQSGSTQAGAPADWNAKKPGSWLPGAQFLNRFATNHTSGRFSLEAVYPNVSNFLGPPLAGSHDGGQPIILHANGDKFLGFQFGASVYKFRPGPNGEDALLLPSAGIVTTQRLIPNGNKIHGGAHCATGHDCSNNGNCNNDKCNCKPGARGDKCQYSGKTVTEYFVFADANGNGLVEAFEWSGPPMEMPGGCPSYFGETIASDLAILCISTGSPYVYRLPVLKVRPPFTLYTEQ
jgi:hypothetical protein